MKSTHFHYCSKSYWPYWLAQYYGGWFEPLITSCADFSYVIQFFWFPNVWKWKDGYCYTSFTYLIRLIGIDNSEFAIWNVVLRGNVNSIQNPFTVTNPSMEPYCVLLPLKMPCRTTWQIIIINQHSYIKHTNKTPLLIYC